MDATQRGRRSDALYYGEVNRRELCDIIANVESENARLRELLADVIPFVAEESGFCPTCDCFMAVECCTSESDVECPAVKRIRSRARELGIEVDE